jgi:hypothetical protein
MTNRTVSFCLATLAALATACAADPPPPAVPARPHAAPVSPVRTLSSDECDSLAQWILAACHDRGSDRAARTEGWCSDIVQHTLPEDRAWIRDCAAHVTEIDEACFRSTRSVPNLMDCDTAVSR